MSCLKASNIFSSCTLLSSVSDKASRTIKSPLYLTHRVSKMEGSVFVHSLKINTSDATKLCYLYTAGDESARKQVSIRFAVFLCIVQATVPLLQDVFEYDAMKNINQIVMGSCDNQAKDECKLATHVVTGVTWGADTYSLFETTYKNNFDKRDIELALAAKLELPIPGFGAEGSGAFELNERLKPPQ